ncbi:MAG: S8 family serine peptidase [Bacteroidota bacterium]
MRWCFFLFFFIGLSSNANAQSLDAVQGQLVVGLERGAYLQEVLVGDMPWLKQVEVLSQNADLYLLHFDPSQYSYQDVEKELLSLPQVASTQPNYLMELRAYEGNDPHVEEQWAWWNYGQEEGLPGADIGAYHFWAYGNGAQTAYGDSIVIALIDNGIHRSHPDLEGQIWVNAQEIPNNQQDEDANGYIDDYLGWNISTQNDLLPHGSHGTKVAGVMVASADNQIGGVGLSWGAKLMVLNCTLGSLSELILAYDYVLSMRQLYEQSNGEQGAFVVATNTSWGVDGLFEHHAPALCDFYDLLGESGVLSCVATSNLPVNIDQQGDLPATCSSPYVISVTASNRQDERTFGAYGQNSVDLAAPGAAIFTTSVNGHDIISGTSFATPMVSSSIALLYSTPCSAAFPAEQTAGSQALQVKQWIIDGVDELSGFQNITLSGGRLNVGNSLAEALALCDDCPQATDFSLTQSVSGLSQLNWRPLPRIDSVVVSWRQLGAMDWNMVTVGGTLVELDEWGACKRYEVKTLSYCAAGAGIASPVKIVQAGNCCERPTLTVDWQEDRLCIETVFAQAGTIQLWRNGALVEEKSLDATPICFEQMAHCEGYQLIVQRVCSSEIQTYQYEQLESFCDPCQQRSYCLSHSQEMGTAWLSRVAIGDWDFASGPDDGYGQFMESGPQLEIGSTYSISLQPGFLHFEQEEYFRVWIDFNQNGVFEATELVVDPGYTSAVALQQSLSIPAWAQPGKTRMRVSMKYLGFGEEPPGPCETFAFGEVEDYCVELMGGTLVSTQQLDRATNWSVKLLGNPIASILQIEVEAARPEELMVQLYNSQGQVVYHTPKLMVSSGRTSLDIVPTQALPKGIYFLQVADRDYSTTLKVLKL